MKLHGGDVVLSTKGKSNRRKESSLDLLATLDGLLLRLPLFSFVVPRLGQSFFLRSELMTFLDSFECKK